MGKKGSEWRIAGIGQRTTEPGPLLDGLGGGDALPEGGRERCLVDVGRRPDADCSKGMLETADDWVRRLEGVERVVHAGRVGSALIDELSARPAARNIAFDGRRHPGRTNQGLCCHDDAIGGQPNCRVDRPESERAKRGFGEAGARRSVRGHEPNVRRRVSRR